MLIDLFNIEINMELAGPQNDPVSKQEVQCSVIHQLDCSQSTEIKQSSHPPLHVPVNTRVKIGVSVELEGPRSYTSLISSLCSFIDTLPVRF